ncbi:MAG: hypothetical protein ACRC0J_06290, partial [Shewanella oncorhynchi]
YSVGKEKDFDFGEGSPSHSEVKFLFTLTVQHQFKVVFPSSSAKSIMQPNGGSWAKQDVTLSSRVPFNISTYSPFSVYLNCIEDQGQCLLKNNNGSVPIQTSITAANFQTNNGAAVSGVPLGVGVMNKTIFKPIRISSDSSAYISFDMDAAGVRVLKNYPGETFKGNVGIVFDEVVP